ncbi:MAG: indolepyruvate oxidoreductase subunit beta family protein [Casimicrobiaceae bacterium]
MSETLRHGNHTNRSFPARPLTILIAALGGEGGAVLADWLLHAAIAGGYPIQSTSIPGVAQRTGATTYYLELYPAPEAQLSGMQPVFALTPSPDNIDLMVASELVEAGRAMQNGYVTQRTTLIAATHRIYATSEKMQIGDGRFDASRILEAGPQLARRAEFIDMATMAQESRTVISAVMFGAIASSGVLPFGREAFEEAIRAGGVGVEASLRGFAAGYAAVHRRDGQDPATARAGRVQRAGSAASAAASVTTATAAAATVPGASTAARAAESVFEARITGEIPAGAQRIVREGVRRVLEYQDTAYATLYLDRVAAVAKAATGDPQIVTETARFLALWMSYEDIVRVADLKTRRRRFARVRDEVLAQAGEPVRLIEYLRPGIQEIADVLPPAFSRVLRGWVSGRGTLNRTGFSMHLNTSSVSGFALLRVLASLRRWRPHSSRFQHEQMLIGQWLAAIHSAGAQDLALGLEIALAARLIKGYGDTHERGAASFARVMSVAADASIAPSGRSAAVRAVREAALADPDGKLGSAKATEYPVMFIKNGGRPAISANTEA